MRVAVHLAAALALAALAFAVGRWLRDPAPGGPLLLLICAAVVYGAAMRRLYAPGGLGRRRAAVAPEPEPPDDRIDLNRADASELEALPGVGPVGARRIVAEREENGPFESVSDLARVAGFSPGRVHALQERVRV
jgi:competence protein ComEA